MANSLFYAYSRRTDNYWASRYLLTFQNAEVAREWWDLVQKEYPDQGIRNGPQLFSFNGDNFLSKPATNKRFDHLKTKWMYSQIGDATGTGGRSQEVIPLQDEDGRSSGKVGRGGSDGSASAAGQLKIDKLSESLEQIQRLMSQNASQIQTLAQNQTASQSRLDALQDIVQENSTQLNKVLKAQAPSQNGTKEKEQNAAQSKEEANRQAALIQQMQLTLDQNAAQIKDLTETLGSFAANFRDVSSVVHKAATPPNEKSANCTHNVRPPPRKIEKKIVGYDYGTSPILKAPLTPSRKEGTNNGRLVNGINKDSVKKKDPSNGVANGSVDKKPSKVH